LTVVDLTIMPNKMENLTSRKMGVKVASEYLGVSTSTVRRWAQGGYLPGIKIGHRGVWKFTENDLNTVIKNPLDPEEFIHNHKDVPYNWASTKKTYEQIVKELSDIKYAVDQSSIVAVTDKDGIILHVNQKFTEISKYSREELIGKTHRVINSKYHSKVFMKDLWDTILSGKVWHGELKNKDKEGNFYWVATTITPFLDEKGRPFQFIAIRNDITERKMIEERKDEFISVASHELKTPLTSLKLNLQLLERELKKAPAQKRDAYLNKALTYTNRLSRLIGDLLDISKIQSGIVEYEMGVVDIDSIIKSSIYSVQPTSEKHKIVQKSSPHVKVKVDKQRIEQVLNNMLTNAIKYSPKSKDIIVDVVKDSDYVTISVKDFGIGIDKNMHNKIFEKYYRVKEVENSFSGLGVGLYVSHEIIKNHGGTMWVESAKGKGSTFYFNLPIHKSK